ncbi:MAG: zinc ABC transporter substrate-binding protein [Tepidisphaeraceae bacterium]
MRRLKTLVRLWTFVAALCVVTGCDRSPSSAAQSNPSAEPRTYPFKAVTTVGMVTDIVRQVAGDKANVTGIIGEGVDPHLYKPTRNDVAALLDGDMIFYSGLMLEGKMSDTLIKVARDGKSVFAVTELIDESFLLQPAEFQGHHDPHVWMCASGWMKAVEAVVQSLGKYDPPNAAYYQANGTRYLAELKKLDDYARVSIASIPENARVLITAHDAFNYFGREYGIRVEGIQGISTESEAGLQRINALVDLIVKQKIGAVFVETSVADKNIRALADGAAARGAKVKIGGSLFSDAMGGPGTYEGTYLGMIDHNVTIITRALGGNAPEKGMQGKLK